MFSQNLLLEIYKDERMRKIPQDNQSEVVGIIEEVIEKRYYSEKYSKEDIMRDICL